MVVDLQDDIIAAGMKRTKRYTMYDGQLHYYSNFYWGNKHIWNLFFTEVRGENDNGEELLRGYTIHSMDGDCRKKVFIYLIRFINYNSAFFNVTVSLMNHLGKGEIAQCDGSFFISWFFLTKLTCKMAKKRIVSQFGTFYDIYEIVNNAL